MVEEKWFNLQSGILEVWIHPIQSTLDRGLQTFSGLHSCLDDLYLCQSGVGEGHWEGFVGVEITVVATTHSRLSLGVVHLVDGQCPLETHVIRLGTGATLRGKRGD